VAALRAYQGGWTELVPLAAIFVVPAQLVLGLVTRALPEGTGRPEAAWSAAAALAALVAALVTFAVAIVEQGAMTWAAMRALLGREPTLGRAASIGLRRFWSVLLVGVLVGLSVGLGLVLLIVPGLIVAVRLAVAMPALIVEDARGRAALRRSWRLVRGRSWMVAGVLVLATFLSWMVAFGVGLVLGLIGLPDVVSGAVAQIIVTPLSALASASAYVELRRRELASEDDLAVELERASPA
jgi:hypothetical protein